MFGEGYLVTKLFLIFSLQGSGIVSAGVFALVVNSC